MPVLTRRTLLATAAVGATVPRARAAEFAWRYGSSIAATHPQNVHMTEAAARIREATHGRVDIQVFADGALGGDTDMLSQVRSGAMQMMDISPLILSTLVPVAAISDVGFAWDGYDQIWAAMDGGLGDVVREGIGKVGLHPFHRIWNNGFREVTTKSRVVATARDFQGLKLRVPVSPILVSMFTALGAAPIGLNFNAVYEALQTGLVDGQENPLAIIETSKLYEVQKHCSLTDHVWDGHWVIANAKTMAGLPPDLQAIVSQEIDRAAVAQRADVQRLNATLRTQLEGQGLAFNTPDRAELRAVLQKSGFFGHWREKFGTPAWDALTAAVGRLG